jgi:hypothetical protein
VVETKKATMIELRAFLFAVIAANATLAGVPIAAGQLG